MILNGFLIRTGFSDAAHGSVWALTALTGTVTDTYDYGAFVGDITSGSNGRSYS